jgi:hypothetical protein
MTNFSRSGWVLDCIPKSKQRRRRIAGTEDGGANLAEIEMSGHILSNRERIREISRSWQAYLIANLQLTRITSKLGASEWTAEQGNNREISAWELRILYAKCCFADRA